jgi:primosomal protein N' (replication factor Y) (superfamily II helicase)
MTLFGHHTPVEAREGIAPEVRLARVVVERGIEQQSRAVGDEGLTYGIAPGMELALGQRVMVPLGRGRVKLVAGVVVQLGNAGTLGAGLDARKLRMIASATRDVVSDELLGLARWLAEYYVCPLGMVLASMVPAAAKKQPKPRSIEGYSLVRRDVEASAGLSKQALASWKLLMALPVGAFPISQTSLTKTGIGISPGVAKRLLAAGVLERRVIPQVPHENSAGKNTELAIVAAGYSPTVDQQRVIDGILAGHGRFGVHLLRGVTGSGKTEVYLRVLETVLSRGQSAIVLVPEIALTPQTAGRFVARFGERAVAVLHSGLSASQRAQAWRRLAEGDARVALGARSAVFAPLANVGLIVVDEEHDGSYKQDQLPRYHGRDVAIKRGQLCGATVVLGSATPALESWANATRQSKEGSWRLWELRDRVGGGVLPRVRVLDMREERRLHALDPTRDQRRMHLLGPTLEAALERTLRDPGAQALLLLNRRGFAHYLVCSKSACGYVQQCEACDCSLVLHKDNRTPGGRVVRCHHCHVEQKVATLCPVCGGLMQALGGGTQRLEEELVRKFAALGLAAGETLLRLDSDTMRTMGAYTRALDRFASGAARVLVGTQMIAKGLDFPGVKLVGVVDADTALALPDFRATERTFQLLSQAAGRAGRASAEGEVLVQSFTPLLPAIVHAASHDYVSFAREELAQRVQAGLPPARRMARVVCRDAVHAKAWERCAQIATAFREGAGAVDVEGPMDCAIARIAGQFRVCVEVLAADAGVLRAALRHVRDAGLVKSDAATAVDVDPIALL